MQTRTPRQQIEDIVDGLLAEIGITSPPVPVEVLARTKGLPIVEQAMDTDISGALVSLGGQSHGIAVNAAHAPVRKRFTVAHELAHYLLGHLPNEDHLDWGFTIIRRDGRSSEANDLKEIEANFFAASLLMPKNMLRADVEAKRGFHGEVTIDEAEIITLAKRYGVSKLAMHYRLMNVGLMSFIE
jgi:Zn-dependent peptidase ImmA (M78 family)